MDVQVAVYAGALLVTFNIWFHHVYLTTKLHPYIDHKKEFQQCDPLTRASVADHTCRELTGQPARLPVRIAEQLEAHGGFVSAGQLTSSQKPLSTRTRSSP